MYYLNVNYVSEPCGLGKKYRCTLCATWRKTEQHGHSKWLSPFWDHDRPQLWFLLCSLWLSPASHDLGYLQKSTLSFCWFVKLSLHKLQWIWYWVLLWCWQAVGNAGHHHWAQLIWIKLGILLHIKEEKSHRFS